MLWTMAAALEVQVTFVVGTLDTIVAMIVIQAGTAQGGICRKVRVIGGTVHPLPTLTTGTWVVERLLESPRAPAPAQLLAPTW